MIGWLIVIGLLLLILAVLLTPLAFQFDYDDVRQHRFYRLSWLGITVLSSEKAGKIRDSSRKKKPKADKPKKQKKKPEEKEKDGKEESKLEKFQRYFHMGFDLLSSLPKPLRMIWKGFSFRRLVIGIQVGKFDASQCAVAYGAVCAVLYPALTFLQSTMRMQLEQVTVQCAFGQEKNRYVLRGVLRFCPLSAVAAAFTLIGVFLWKYLRRVIREKQQGCHKKSRKI